MICCPKRVILTSGVAVHARGRERIVRIGLFTDGYLPEISGVTTAIHVLKKELERLEHEVHVYAPHYKGYKDEQEGVFRFYSRRFLFNKGSRVALPYSRKATRSFKNLDIVHSHTPFSMGVLALVVGLRYSIPHIHTYHTYLTEYRHYLPRLFRPPKKTVEEISAIFCNRCTAVTVPSTSVKNELLRYGVHRSIHVLPFGVDLSLFQRPPAWNPRQELNIPPEAPLLLYAGRLAKEKNLPFLLQVFERVHSQIPESVFVLTGDGPDRDHLKSLVKDSLLNRSVFFTGFLDRACLIDLYKAARLFLFASKTETQGLVIIEAMAGGTPAVAIGSMGVVDVIKDGVNGLLAPEDEQEFARIVIELLRDNEYHSTLQRRALDTAVELSSEKCALRLLEVLEGLVQ